MRIVDGVQTAITGLFLDPHFVGIVPGFHGNVPLHNLLHEAAWRLRTYLYLAHGNQNLPCLLILWK